MAVHHMLMSLGFSPQAVLEMGFDHRNAAVKQRLLDVEGEGGINRMPNVLALEDTRYVIALATYLSALEIPSQRKTFSLDRW